MKDRSKPSWALISIKLSNVQAFHININLTCNVMVTDARLQDAKKNVQ
jgi:hypothetical protein